LHPTFLEARMNARAFAGTAAPASVSYSTGMVTTWRGLLRRLPVAGALLLAALFVASPPHVARAHRAKPAGKAPPRGGIRLAITIDDFPGGGPETGEFTHPRMVADIIAALRAHGVKHATGFVVGEMLEGHPERQAALDSWIEAGFEVGNHTYTHPSLAEMDAGTYVADIETNRPLVESLEKRTGQPAHYFRAPYLDEGNTEADRRTLTHYLAAHNYKMARVSMDFSDWAYAEPFARCLEKGDRHALDLLQQSYLEEATAALSWSAAAAQQVVGHPVTQVLLLHASLATSQTLDAMLTAFDNLGVHYTSLAEALSHEIYNGQYDISGTNVFVQASRKLGKPHPPALVRPLALLDLSCR
jgi:peptidoglycan/xylan/chitin deacetylase (PgdA/CDA1 family)